MEKYIGDASKWFDENQNLPNAREIFTNKRKEAEEFFAPFYANVTCKKNMLRLDFFNNSLLYIHSGNRFE
jgi:hypothetical protein